MWIAESIIMAVVSLAAEGGACAPKILSLYFTAGRSRYIYFIFLIIAAAFTE